MGATSFRQSAAGYANDASSFNLGQDHGDVTSVVVGAAMVEGGGTAASGGAAVLVTTGGTTAPVSGAVALTGAAVAAEGAIMIGTGAANLANQKGRLNAEGSESQHGNSKASQREQHGYKIKNNRTGETTEYGISGQKLKNDGGSPRVTQKLRTKYGNDSNYSGEVIKTGMKNRRKALNWEQQKVNNFNNQNGQPPLNQKRPLPEN